MLTGSTHLLALQVGIPFAVSTADCGIRKSRPLPPFLWSSRRRNASTKDGRVREAGQEEKPAGGAESWDESYFCPLAGHVLEITCRLLGLCFSSPGDEGDQPVGFPGIRSKAICGLRSQKRQKTRRTVLRFYCPTLNPAPKRVRITTEGVSFRL